MKRLTLDELRLKLDQVPCKPRLYPTGLYALQLITGKDIAAMIDRSIIQPLINITGYGGQPFRYEFTDRTLSFKSSYTEGIPASWVEQLISDFIVFGLREAILYFHTYEFEADASELIHSSISLYHELAQLYLLKKKEIESSKDERISRLVMITKLRGEGTPQQLARNK